MEKKQLEEEISCIERKKQIQQTESNYAHMKAQKYKEELKIENQLNQQISQMRNVQDNKPKDVKNIDYTQTRFHNVQTTIHPA